MNENTIILTQIVTIGGYQVTMEFTRDDHPEIMNEVQTMLISALECANMGDGGMENDEAM